MTYLQGGTNFYLLNVCSSNHPAMTVWKCPRCITSFLALEILHTSSCLTVLNLSCMWRLWLSQHMWNSCAHEIKFYFLLLICSCWFDYLASQNNQTKEKGIFLLFYSRLGWSIDYLLEDQKRIIRFGNNLQINIRIYQDFSFLIIKYLLTPENLVLWSQLWWLLWKSHFL